MTRPAAALIIACLVSLLSAACEGEAAGPETDASDVSGDIKSPVRVTASDLYGHWVAFPTRLGGPYGYLSFVADDPRTGARDAYATVTERAQLDFGTFTIASGVVDLDSRQTDDGRLEITAFSSDEMLVSGAGFTSGTRLVRRARCHGAGDWQVASLEHLTGAWDRYGDLHQVGPGLPVLSTRKDICGALPLAPITGGFDAHADWDPGGAGAVWVVDMQADGRVVLYGFDPLDPKGSLVSETVAETGGVPGIHTELHLATRPGNGSDLAGVSGVIIASGGMSNVWEKVDGVWVDHIKDPPQGLLDVDVDLFFDPDGRLCGSNGGRVLCEVTAGAGDLAPWSHPAPASTVAGAVNQGVRYAWDAAGRLHTVWTEVPPKINADSIPNTESWHALVHGVQLPDGSWSRTELGPGIALDLAFDTRGVMHLSALPLKTSNGGAQVEVFLDAAGKPERWAYRRASDAGGSTVGGAQTKYVSIDVSQYEHDYPIGKPGPNGEYFVRAGWSTPRVEYHFGQDGAPTYEVPVDFTAEPEQGATGGAAAASADVRLEVPGLGVTCTTDCVLELEGARYYEYRLGGTDMALLGSNMDSGQWLSEWGWFLGPIATRGSTTLDPAAMTVKTTRGRVRAVERVITGEEVRAQHSFDLDIDPAGRRLYTWRSVKTCNAASGSWETMLTLREPSGAAAADACWSGPTPVNVGFAGDGSVVMLASGGAAFGPTLASSDDSIVPADVVLVHLDRDDLSVRGGLVLSRFGAPFELSALVEAGGFAFAGSVIGVYGRDTLTGAGRIARYDMASGSALPSLSVPFAPPNDHDREMGLIAWHAGTWIVMGGTKLAGLADLGDGQGGTELRWSRDLPWGTHLAVGADGVVHAIGESNFSAPPDLGGGPLPATGTSIWYARYAAADGAHLSSRWTNGGGLDGLTFLSDGALAGGSGFPIGATVAVLDALGDRLSRTWSVKIGGILMGPNLPATGRAAVAVDPRDGTPRMFITHPPQPWIDYDRFRVFGTEGMQTLELELDLEP